jgi:hypothetical protein
MKAIITNIKKRDISSTLAVTDKIFKRNILNLAVDKFDLPGVLEIIYDKYVSDPENSPGLLVYVLEILSTLQTPIKGIVFDEANLYFNDESLPFLNCLTALTKQNKEIFVIMATSDYGLPFTLSKIGYNVNHFSTILVMSDVSPTDMLLLLETWGVRPALAYLLVDIYGGHILQIARALKDLDIRKEDTEYSYSFISGIGNQIVACRYDAEKCGKIKEVAVAMYCLIKTGFYACQFTNSAAEIITKHNVGGFVDSFAILPGLPKSVRTDTSGLIVSGLVPSSQMMRIYMATLL